MVTVILPSYNHSKYLKKRIDSILEQTYQDFELIILDDKSPDNSAEIIESYRGHDRVSNIIINRDNSGSTFAQWDRGFELAKGEYIWIAESDDYADPRFLELCVGALERDSSAVLCFADSHFVDENGDVIHPRNLEKLIMPLEGDDVMVYSSEEMVRKWLLRHNYLYNASMILFRKSALGAVSHYYKGLRGCGDWAFWGEVAMQGKLLRVPQRLNYFRQHTNKVTKRMRDNRVGFFESGGVLMHLLSLYLDRFGDQIGVPMRSAIIGNTVKRVRGVIKRYSEDLNHDIESVARAYEMIDELDTRGWLYRRFHKMISKRQYI